MPWGKMFLLFTCLLLVVIAIYRFSGGVAGAGMQDLSQNNMNSALLIFGTLGAGYLIYQIATKHFK